MEKKIVVPGELVSNNKDATCGEGTYKKNDKIYSSTVGILNDKNNKIRVVKLGGSYIPQLGDYVVGKITDMNFSNWFVDIQGPYDAALPLREASREYIDLDKHDMTYYYNYNDLVFARIIDINNAKKITLTAKEPELKKLKGGIVTKITPSKVPRLIGSKGNMINMIKDKTKTQIIIGQNGLVWINGKASDMLKAKQVIQVVNEESHKSGLTDKIEKMLGGKK